MMDIKDFSLVPLESPYGVFELRYNKNDYRACVFTSPTANCQLYSIGNADSILWQEKDLRLELFRLIYRNVQKKIMLLDIKPNLELKLLEIFNESEIISKTQYKSTNGSDMLIVLVKTQTLYVPQTVITLDNIEF